MEKELIKRLIFYLKPYRKRIIIALVISVAVGALSTSPIPLVKVTFDKIFAEKDFFLLAVIPPAIFLLFVAKGVLSYVQQLIILRVGLDLIVELRLRMFSHIHQLPYGFFERVTTGELMSRVVGDVNASIKSLANTATEAVRSLVMFVGLVIWLFYLNWKWAFAAIILFPLAIMPISVIAKKLRHLGRRGQELIAEMNSTILESFSGIKTIRAFDLEKIENKKYYRQINKFLAIKRKNIKYKLLTSPLMEILGVSVGTGILWYGGDQVLTGKISQGDFLAFILAMFMMYGPLRGLLGLYAKMQNSLAAAERVFWVLDQEKESFKDGGLELNAFEKNIEYKNVTFKYPTRNIRVLDNINLVVNKTEVLAIVGMSGAGKTTLVDLLFKFYNLTTGQILIDGIDINEISSKSLRSNLALVTQETFLFNDTIWNNIAFGHPGASKEDILKAAEAARVAVFVNKLYDGYETVIGERGLMLSGGQRQRISIARAILRNAPILVLDEATSSLDSESEKLVQEALYNLMENRTTFVIAHRLATIQHADKIVVMEHGEIVGMGTHETLMNDCELYQKYHRMQFSGV
jgi:subfamily B ATP-binding cassette protein MsbA